MVEYRQGIPGQQLILYQQCIDELIDSNSVVRVVDACIDTVDMDSLGLRINEQDTGARAYAPQLKLKIYVYGYLNGVCSSRRLERECRRTVELLWLTQGLAPDFKTIADFRKDNADGLKATFKAFLLMCARLQLLGFESVVAEVTNQQNDKQQLTRMIEHIGKQKEELEVDSQTSVIADTGYFSETQIMGTKDAEDCSPVVSAGGEGQESSQSTSGKNREVPSEAYENDKFRYDQRRDVYVCPERQELARITAAPAIDRHGGRATHKYRAEAQVCMGCRARSACTRSEKGRMIRVSANRKAMEEYLELLKSPTYKRLTAQRKEIVEHPFGTLKRSLGYTYFLVKGLGKVKAEFSLMCLAYNLKRVFNIVGFQCFMAAMR